MSNNKTKTVTLTPRDIKYQQTFKSGPGIHVIEDLKKMLRHGENVYFPGQPNEDLHYHLGRQSVINEILFILNKEAN